MRPDCSWSMSTAGLTAQEVCLPSQALFLRGSHCHSMAGTKPSWNHHHDFDNLYFSMDSSVDYGLPTHQPLSSSSSVEKPRSTLSRNSPLVQKLPPKKFRPSALALALSSSSEPLTPSPVEDDPFQRLSVCDRVSPPLTPSRLAKPLPPLPSNTSSLLDHLSSSSEQVQDIFFAVDDSCRLVPDAPSSSGSVTPSPFRYGMPSRRSCRGRGMVNYAYHDGPAPVQQQQQKQPQPQPPQPPQPPPSQHPQHPPEPQLQHHPHHHHHHHHHHHQHQHQHQPQQRRQEKELPEQHQQHQQHHTPHQHPHPHPHHQQQQQPSQDQAVQDRAVAVRKLRRSHSGPAGSFNKPTSLRLSCHHRNATNHGCQDAVMDKPEIPPRAPIPPRPAKTADYRRWSAEVSSGAYSDEDRPPKVPPREPLSSTSTSSARTPSPKCLPTYVNGIMPPTQSFAPDPKYVSRGGLQRQNSEGSPCILPVMENGRKASNTHYFLLPQRPPYLDKLEKFLTDGSASRGGGGGGGGTATVASISSSRPSGDDQTNKRRTPPIDLV